MNKHDYIRHATNERIAQMLEEHNKWRRGQDPYNQEDDKGYYIPSAMPFDATELGIIIEEAVRRLRIPPHQTFNDEAFDI